MNSTSYINSLLKTNYIFIGEIHISRMRINNEYNMRDVFGLKVKGPLDATTDCTTTRTISRMEFLCLRRYIYQCDFEYSASINLTDGNSKSQKCPAFVARDNTWNFKGRRFI